MLEHLNVNKTDKHFADLLEIKAALLEFETALPEIEIHILIQS